jgi:hypothetical protein
LITRINGEKMAEKTFDKIVRKTGKKPVSCKCETCKVQCRKAPCIGTPEDIEKIINADGRYYYLLADSVWASGVPFGIAPKDFIAPLMLKDGCGFFVNGLCILHDLGLKPTEGRLSHHTAERPRRFQDTINYHVASTWTPEEYERIKGLLEAKNGKKEIKDALNDAKNKTDGNTSSI